MTIIKNVGNTCAYKFQHISETWKFYSHCWTKTLFERKVITGVYQIRWSERERESDVSYKPFYLALPFFVEVFEVINGAHKFEEISTKGWGTKSKVEATQFLNPLTKFEFVVGIIALCRRLHSVAGITRHLQLMLLMHTKMNVDQLKVELKIPRVAKKQIHRDNVQPIRMKSIIKELLLYQFLTHLFLKWHICPISSIVKQLNDWFWQYLFCSKTSKENVDISSILEEYEEDLIEMSWIKNFYFGKASGW